MGKLFFGYLQKGGNRLANIRSAAKRARQNIKRETRGRYYRSSARTYIKKAQASINAGDFEEAEEMIRLATKTLDKAAQKGAIHPNNAARRKSRLARALNQARS
jgi:small subunit ribosomal protein S20